MTINAEKALDALREFRDLLTVNKMLHEEYGGDVADNHDSEHKLKELEPLIEMIAEEVESDPEWHRAPSHGVYILGTWRRSNRVNWVDRLIGIIQNRARYDAIFTPEGPKLVASQLHPWVWNAARDLWDDGHYREAVQTAATAVEQQTKIKIEREDLSGADLYMKAFNTQEKPGESRLRFRDVRKTTANDKTTKDWQSLHEGAMHFGRGCAQGIRNLVTHDTADVEEQVALEHLAALSVLARWVGTAELQIV